MQEYQNYNSQGTLIYYNNVEINSIVSVRISSIYEIEIIAIDLPKDFITSLNKEEIVTLKIKSKGKYITVYDIYNHEISYTMNRENYANEAKIYASHALIGEEFVNVDNLFSSSIIEITNGDELLGIYPYKITHENKFDISKEKLTVEYNLITYTVSTVYYDLDFNSIPIKDLSIKTNLLEFKGKIAFNYKFKRSIKQIRENHSELLKFFNILCGENITCTDIVFENEEKVYDAIGYVNYPKHTLNQLKEDGFDYKCYLRQAIPKISDFKEDIQRIYINWLKLYNKHKLIFKIYSDLRLIKENHLFTINTFLQICQIIEGYERPKVKASGKEEVLLRDCLNSFTKYAISLINTSEFSIEQKRNYEKLIDNIVFDRNVYTHVDCKKKPRMDTNELNRVVVCYCYLFRTVILADIGVNIQQINNRLFFNRDYQFYLKKLFGINAVRINYTISEFDDQVY